MSLHRFDRRKRYVRLGGRTLGPLAFGGRWYEIRKLTLWEFLDYQAACAMLEQELGLEAGKLFATDLPAAFRPLLPVLLATPIRPRDLRRASDEQVMMAVAEFGHANDIKLCTDAFTPADQGEGVGFEVLVCQIARDLHKEPQTILAWPLVELLGYIEACKVANPDPQDENSLAHYGLDGKGYEVVSRGGGPVEF